MSKYDKELDTRTKEYEEASKPLQRERDEDRGEQAADEQDEPREE